MMGSIARRGRASPRRCGLGETGSGLGGDELVAAADDVLDLAPGSRGAALGGVPVALEGAIELVVPRRVLLPVREARAVAVAQRPLELVPAIGAAVRVLVVGVGDVARRDRLLASRLLHRLAHVLVE